MDLQNSMKKVPGINDGDVRGIAQQGIPRLSGDMLFPSRASNISPGSPSDNAIKALSLALAKVLPCFTFGPAGNPSKDCNPNAVFIDAVFVAVHTDNVPITGSLEGNTKDNLFLSALTALHTLTSIYKDQASLEQTFSI